MAMDPKYLYYTNRRVAVHRMEVPDPKITDLGLY